MDYPIRPALSGKSLSERLLTRLNKSKKDKESSLNLLKRERFKIGRCSSERYLKNSQQRLKKQSKREKDCAFNT